MNAVGSNYERSAQNFAGLEGQLNMLVALDDADAALSDLYRVRFEAPDRIGENAVQVSTVQHDVGSAIASSRGRAELEPAPRDR